jgi:hypothetical protein
LCTPVIALLLHLHTINLFAVGAIEETEEITPKKWFTHKKKEEKKRIP